MVRRRSGGGGGGRSGGGVEGGLAEVCLGVPRDRFMVLSVSLQPYSRRMQRDVNMLMHPLPLASVASCFLVSERKCPKSQIAASHFDTNQTSEGGPNQTSFGLNQTSFGLEEVQTKPPLVPKVEV